MHLAHLLIYPTCTRIRFWKLRQAEWEPYTLLNSPLRITQGWQQLGWGSGMFLDAVHCGACTLCSSLCPLDAHSCTADLPLFRVRPPLL